MMRLLVEKDRLIFKPEFPYDHFVLGAISGSKLASLVKIVNDTDNPNPTVVALEIKKEDLLKFLVK